MKPALLNPVHPGEILREDFMKPLKLTQCRVAKNIGVPQLRISEIVRGKRAVSADTAMRLARYFGTSAGVWMRLQAQYDLEVAVRSHRDEDSLRDAAATACGVTPKLGEILASVATFSRMTGEFSGN